MLQRAVGILVDELAGGDEASCHLLGNRASERSKLATDRRIELIRGDLVGDRRLVGAIPYPGLIVAVERIARAGIARSLRARSVVTIAVRPTWPVITITVRPT
jgi:hypothetical protein